MNSDTKTGRVIAPQSGHPLHILGHSVMVKLTSADSQGDSYIFEVVSPAGLGIPPHVHTLEDEYIFVAEGTFQIFLDGEQFHAPAGSWLHFPRGIPHGFQNVGETASRTLWVVVPGKSFEQFFDELSSLPADLPPDPGRVAAIFGAYGMEILPAPGA